MRSMLYVRIGGHRLRHALAQIATPRSTPAGIDQLCMQLASADAETRASAACVLRQKSRRAAAPFRR